MGVRTPEEQPLSCGVLYGSQGACDPSLERSELSAVSMAESGSGAAKIVVVGPARAGKTLLTSLFGGVISVEDAGDVSHAYAPTVGVRYVRHVK